MEQAETIDPLIDAALAEAREEERLKDPQRRQDIRDRALREGREEGRRENQQELEYLREWHDTDVERRKMQFDAGIERGRREALEAAAQIFEVEAEIHTATQRERQMRKWVGRIRALTDQPPPEPDPVEAAKEAWHERGGGPAPGVKERPAPPVAYDEQGENDGSE
jgi:hypothetical protein